ncbi:MAG TPA: TonB family protein [Ensifer sp.]|nr:TonB family protein [Ensifer sp.]
MNDLHIDKTHRRSVGSVAGEAARRRELRSRRRTFHAWPLLPVPALSGGADTRVAPTVEWPQGGTILGGDELHDRVDERVRRDFVPTSESPTWDDSAEQKQAGRRSRLLKACLLGSVALHLSCAVFLISLPAAEHVEIAGGGAVSVVLVGEQNVDSLAAGTTEGVETTLPTEEVKTAEQAVEATTAQELVEPIEKESAPSEPVTPALQPVAETPAEPAAADTPPEQPAEAPAEIQSQTVAEVAPQPENHAIDPAAVSDAGELTPEQPIAAPEAHEKPPVETSQAAPVEPQEALEAVKPQVGPDPTPVEKKAPVQKKIDDRKTEEKKIAARKKAEADREARREAAKKRKGEAGESTANAQRGASENAHSAQSAEPGNAAVSNYPGKVAAKLRRALKYPKSAVAGSRGETQVAFTVQSDGSATGIRVVSSSGSPALDQAAVEAVRRASPFPPIPAEAGRRQWPFAVPVLFKR